MRCIYCEAEIIDGEVFCPECGKAVQMVPDYNEFDDDYIDGLIGNTTEEREQKKAQQKKALAKKKKQKELEEMKKRQKNLIMISSIASIIAIIIIVIAVSQSIKNKYNNSVDYQLSKAHSALNSGNVQEAIDYYENAIALDADNTDIKLELADLFESNNNADGAIILYEEIIDLDSENKEAYSKLIKLYDAKQDYDSIILLSSNVKNAQILKLFDKYIVTPPILSVDGGEYEDSLELKITSSAGADVYYSLEGEDPYTKGQKYKKELKFDEIGEYSVTAVCVNDKGIISEPVTEEYTIISSAPDTPVVSPNGGNFISETRVYVTVPQNCNAYYTWDGTEPTINSNLYTGEIVVPEGNNVLSVILVNEKGKASDVYKGRFEYYIQENVEGINN